MASGWQRRTRKRLTKEERLGTRSRARWPSCPRTSRRGCSVTRGLTSAKIDDFEPDLNAGMSQENDMPVLWMAIVLGYLMFFVPGLHHPLDVEERIPMRTKVIASVVMAVGSWRSCSTFTRASEARCVLG